MPVAKLWLRLQMDSDAIPFGQKSPIDESEKSFESIILTRRMHERIIKLHCLILKTSNSSIVQ